MAHASRTALIAVVTGHVVEQSGMDDREGVFSRLMDSDEAYLLLLKRTFESGGELAKLAAEYISKGAPDNQINQMLHFAPKTGVTDCRRAASLSFGLPSYPHLKHLKDITAMDAEEEKRSIALMRVTHVVDIATHFSFPATDALDVEKIMHRGNLLIGMPYKFGGKSQRLKDASLVELVCRNVDDVDRIISFIEDEGIWEPRLISAALEGIHLSLAEGGL